MSKAENPHPQISYLRRLLGEKSFTPDAVFNGKGVSVYPTGGYWPQFRQNEGRDIVGITRIHHQDGDLIVKSATIILLPQAMLLNSLPMVEMSLRNTPLTIADMRFSIAMTVSQTGNYLIASSAEHDLQALKIRPFIDLDIVTGFGVTNVGLSFSGTKSMAFGDLLVNGYKMARLTVDESVIHGVSLVQAKTAQKWLDAIISILKQGISVSSESQFGSRTIAKKYDAKTVYLLNEVAKKIAEQRGESFTSIPFDPIDEVPEIPGF